jgi:hypothetical protein
MKTLLILCLLVLLVRPAWATWDEWEGQPPITQPDAEWKKPGNFLSEFGQMLEGLAGTEGGKARSGQMLIPSPDGQIYLGPITPNAYGPGIHSDSTGRPFTYQPDFGSGGGHLQVTPDAYGPGVGMDQYGRPVRPKRWP